MEGGKGFLEEEGSEDEVGEEDGDGSGDDGKSCGASDSLGSFFTTESLIASHDGDEESESGSFYES